MNLVAFITCLAEGHEWRTARGRQTCLRCDARRPVRNPIRRRKAPSDATTAAGVDGEASADQSAAP
jgi:hypothetical protein